MQCVARVLSPLCVSRLQCTSRLSHMTHPKRTLLQHRPQRTGSPHAPRVSTSNQPQRQKTTARQQERRRTNALISRLSTCSQDYKPPERLPDVQTQACTRAASSYPWPHRHPSVSPPQDGRVTAAQRQIPSPISTPRKSTNGALSGPAQGAAHAAPLPPVLWLAQCFSSAFLYSGTLFQSAAACPLRGLSKLGSPSKL